MSGGPAMSERVSVAISRARGLHPHTRLERKRRVPNTGPTELLHYELA